MNRTFLLAIMAIVCLGFTGTAIADQYLAGKSDNSVENPNIEYEWGLTDNLVIIGTGNRSAFGLPTEPNDGNLHGHAWLGGPGSVVSQELAIGKPGFKKSTWSGYDASFHAQGSLVLREDDSYGYKTVGEVTVDGDLNIGGGLNGGGSDAAFGYLFIPVGSVTANSGVKVGIGTGATGLISISGGAFNLGSSATLKLSDSEDPGAADPPIGNGTIEISGGSMTAAAGSSITIGSMGKAHLVIQGQAITSISLDSVEVTESGVVAFTLDDAGADPDVAGISSPGNFYFKDGSIIDLDFATTEVENLLSSYGDASAARVIDLVTSPDLKWNEAGYHAALSYEDDFGWDLQVTGNTLQAKYLGGTGSDLIVNSGTAGSPTPISAGLYRNIYIGYGTEVPETPIVVNGHASINNADVKCSSDLDIARGDNCDGSLSIGTGGSLSVFAGNLVMGSGSGADATLNLSGDANLFVMYQLRMSDADAPPTLVSGTAELNISDTANLETQYLMVGDYDDPGPACTVNQTGGTVTVRDSLYIGRNSEAGAQGSTYHMSGSAKLDVGDTLNVGLDNMDPSIASTLQIDGSDATVLTRNFNVATYCTLKFTVDDGADYKGDVSPIDLRGHKSDAFAYFHAQYLPDTDTIDGDKCAVIEMAFAPGTESLMAALPLDPIDFNRGIDVVLMDYTSNFKWQANDTGYDDHGNVASHLYGLKFADSNWTMSEIPEWNNREIDGVTPNPYAHLRAYYIGPQTPIPQPTADAGPDQTGLVAEEPVTLDGSGSSVTVGRSIVQYEWDWEIAGDTYSIIDTDPYAEAYFPVGTHTVTLVVTSDIGETDSDTCVIGIPSARIPGDIDGSDVVDLGDFVILKNNFGHKDPDLP